MRMLLPGIYPSFPAPRAAGQTLPAPGKAWLRPLLSLAALTLAHHRPAWATSANDRGPVASDLKLEQMTLVLARSSAQQAALTQLLADQQNPASPSYHHWLTPEEMGQRFGLSDQDIAAITAWLQSQGLHVNWVAPSRIFLGFGGAAADVNRAFQTELHTYTVNGESRYSIASDPAVPAALAPAIKAIRGLSTPGEKPQHHASALQSPSPLLTGSGGAHYIAPADFATLYHVPAAYTGAGVTIGIVGWSRVDLADLDNFRSLTGTAFPNPSEVVPTAFGGVDPGNPYTTTQTCSTCTDAQGEATLDVQRAGSIAPAASLLLVVSSSSGTNDGIGADAQYLVNSSPAPAQVMNISFGDCESSAGKSNVDYWDALFQSAAAEGISVFVSSGDSGAAGCDTAFKAPPSSSAPNSPNSICSSSYATCVGGTEFNEASGTYWNASNGSNLSSVLSYIPEGGWNESSTINLSSSGGGVSSYIATPSWQVGTGVPSARAGRYTPDVAFSASAHDAYFACMAAAGGSCVVSNGSFSFGAFEGTSATAPAMAGVAALLDQKLGAAQGNLNPGLYATASAYPLAYHDVTVATSGVTSCVLSTPSMCNNSIESPTGVAQDGYAVGAGYDEVTGLGSLDVLTFLNEYTTLTGTSSFSIAGTTVTISSPGAIAGNTSTITVTPSSGFSGSATVTLSATLTSSPSGALYPPTFNFNPLSVNIASASAGTSQLTISTTADTYVALASPTRKALPWYTQSGAVLACILLFGIPARRRRWRNLLGMAALCVLLAGGVLACGSGGGGGGGSGVTGTTPGAYTFTVTGAVGSTTVTSQAITLTVN
jgi:subtilase family serine protease